MVIIKISQGQRPCMLNAIDRIVASFLMPRLGLSNVPGHLLVTHTWVGF